ncbi:MAG: protein kinase domain-containing protein [Gammaproteobacteria bacterium]
MSDFETLLHELLQGKTPLAPLRAWLQEYFATPGNDSAPIEAAITTAQRAGLSQPLANALRKQVNASLGNTGTSTPAAGDTETITAATATTTRTQPANAAAPTTTAVTRTQTITDTGPMETTPDTTRSAATVTQTSPTPASGGDADPTLLISSTRTQEPTSTAVSERSGSGASDYDPFATDATSVAASHQSGQAHGKGGHAHDRIGPGTVLKQRFELVNVLGEGGMGKVFRARDLLKVEAKDKNPYIAVKTLSGDFRQHPEAFMALQREASKAQRLAHPNIATVFDFDRDGSTIYLTMELMEGEELSSFIKRLPAGGLPVPEAMKLIRQLCDGLAYAHSKGLVHSDFKPGNAFITADGTVKLLDFGIARASKTRRDASGVTTLFDPSGLGALTPAYASLEMFDGEDPDPRDDIYALACVAYELLTGKHPFNKLSAPKILEKGLRPAGIAKLNRRQNRALFRALAVTRDNRTPSVEEFWEGLRPKKSRLFRYTLFAAVLVLVIAALGYKPMQSYLRAHRNNAMLAQINSGSTDIPSALSQIAGFDPDSQRFILENGKNRIIRYFESQAEAFVNQGNGQYNYPAALDEIARAARYFPDSAELAQEKASLESRRANLLVELTKEFNTRLAAGQILPGSTPSIVGVIRTLRSADPTSPFLNDERLINQYTQQARKDAAAKDYAAASQVLTAGLNYAPNDADLLNLHDQVRRELRRERDAPEIAILQARLQTAAPRLQTLADYTAVRADLLELHRLDPADPVLAKLVPGLSAALQTALRADATAKQWTAAEQSLFEYAPVLGLDVVFARRGDLSEAESRVGYQPPNPALYAAKLQAERTALERLLAKPSYSPDWNNQVATLSREVAALSQPADLREFGQLRTAVAASYVELARQLTRQNRFDAAATVLTAGTPYAPHAAALAEADQALDQARQRFAQLQAERLRTAQVVALENQFQVQLNAGQIDDARKIYASLQKQLPPNDKFFGSVAPQAYANAYLSLAQARAASGDFHGAIALDNGGLQYAPLPALQEALQKYTLAAAQNDLVAMVNKLQPADMDKLKSQLAKVQQLEPGEQNQLRDSLYRRLAQHIEELKTGNLLLANQLLGAAQTAFPQSLILRNMILPPPPKISPFAAPGRAALAQNTLSKAQEDLEQGEKSMPGNAELQQFATQLAAAQADAGRYFAAYQGFMRAGDAQQAKAYLVEAMRLWNDNPAYQAEYQRNFAVTQPAIQSPNGGKPCTAGLAGYGQQGRAECYDLLGNNLRGPALVVVPAGGAFKQPFAIGKYAVSTGEVNDYCAATRSCKPLPGAGDLPARGLPFSEVQAYVAWLSSTSHERYFIPSYAQYRYAASVADTNTSRDFNCQVTLAGQIIKGMALVNIQTGRPNAWGLVNYVGNVQEWVLGSDGLEAVGGSYHDPLSLCSVDLVRSSNGAADPLIGFRVGRNLDQ